MAPTEEGRDAAKRSRRNQQQQQQQLYNPSSLPVRIDLSAPDTLEQLRKASRNPRVPSSCFATSRGTTETAKDEQQHGRGDRSMQLRSEGRARGRLLIESNLERYIRKLRKKEPTLDCSTEDVFVSWLRYFHKEYDDEWFSKNYKRLAHGPFREVFDAFNNIGGDAYSSADTSADAGKSNTNDLLMFEEIQEKQDSQFDPLMRPSVSPGRDHPPMAPADDVLDLSRVRSRPEAPSPPSSNTDACLIDL